MQTSAVMRLSAQGPGANSASSSAVVRCSTCSREPWARASSTARVEDFRQASRLRISGWYSSGMSGPWRASYAAMLASMVGVSSQWVAISSRQPAKCAASASGSSTSMSPVEAPMKIFRPQAGVSCARAVSAALALVAPR